MIIAARIPFDRFLPELKSLLQEEFGANPLLKKKKQMFSANRFLFNIFSLPFCAQVEKLKKKRKQLSGTEVFI